MTEHTQAHTSDLPAGELPVPKKGSSMKVAVKVTLDIDVDAWMEAYGSNQDEVRRDVRTHAANVITEHLRELGLLGQYIS